MEPIQSHPCLCNGSACGAGWYTADVTLTAGATDATSGVASSEVSADGGGWGSSATLTEGTHSVSARAFDNAGNSASTSGTVRVDTTLPSATFICNGSACGGNWYTDAGGVAVSLSATDATSGIVPGSAVFTYNGGATWVASALLPDGAYNVEGRASDFAGNTVTVNWVVQIDSVAPTLQILYNGDPVPSGWGGLMHITATATDATSGVYSYGFTVNGGPLVTDAMLGDGYYVIEGYAEDTAGNITRTREIVGVDTTAPTTAWNAAPDWVRGTVTLRGHSDDAGSGVASVYISFDGKTWIRVGSDPDWVFIWDTTRYADQLYMIEARAVDVAGNEEHTSYLVVGVDNTNPLVDLSPEWTAPSAGDAGGSDATSGIARARVTISGHGIAPWVQDYGTVPGTVDWNGKDGNGAQAGYGDYDVMLEVWDRAKNYNVTYGVIHLLAPPPPEPEPTEVKAIVAAPTAMPTAAPVIEEKVIPAAGTAEGAPVLVAHIAARSARGMAGRKQHRHRARPALERTARNRADSRPLPRSK